ncbi:MBG domain-containing protein [Methylobacterium sp. WSM2598]|uniref:MBG domain-containing protein n=1 Tax=Methylobacterium sp. WSM2598 TaxID=398261 RepID=UPI00037A18CD|nr:MBG domain-containing protein [Methylobacterium sp. WSM2598]
MAAGTLGSPAGYGFAFAASGRLTVAPATLTVTPEAGQSKVYGGADPGLRYGVTGLVVNPGLGVDDSGLRLSGALGRAPGETVADGPYAYTLGSLAAGANYTLTLAPDAPRFAITPRPLTVVGGPVSRVYGEANPALSYRVGGMGLVNGDALAGALTTAADGASNIGAYAIGQGTLAVSPNYILIYRGADLTVTPRPVTLTGRRTYDAATGFGTGTLQVAGAADGERLTLVAGNGRTAASDAGLYAGSPLAGLVLAVAGGNGLASNYRLPASGTLTVTPAPVVVSARSGASIYGERPTDPGLAASGLQGGQGVEVLTGLSNSFGITARTGVADSPVTLTVAGTLTNQCVRAPSS